MFRRQKISINEALVILDIKPNENITEDLIKSKFGKLSLAVHPDKNPDIDKKEATEKLTKIVAAKKVLLDNLDNLKSSINENNSNTNILKDIGFVDFIKSTGKNKSPFTTYRKGKSK